MYVLNELYRSEIRPDEENSPMIRELKEARNEFVSFRETVFAQLDDVCREGVQDVLERRTELAALEMEDAYVRGMRMGARMTAALLGQAKDHQS